MNLWLQLTPDQKFTILLALGSALFGGALSLLGSYFSLKLSHRLDREKRLAEERKNEALGAFATFSAIAHGCNYIEGLRRHIDEMFKDANNDGLADMEPWAKVKELVGSAYEHQSIDPAKLKFLIECGKAELFNEVLLVSQRIASIHATHLEYNALRRDFLSFLEVRIQDASTGDGTQMGGFLEGRDAQIGNAKSGLLNNFLGQLLASLEDDCDRALAVAKELKDAAEKTFGHDFPKFQFDRVLEK